MKRQQPKPFLLHSSVSSEEEALILRLSFLYRTHYGPSVLEAFFSDLLQETGKNAPRIEEMDDPAFLFSHIEKQAQSPDHRRQLMRAAIDKILEVQHKQAAVVQALQDEQEVQGSRGEMGEQMNNSFVSGSRTSILEHRRELKRKHFEIKERHQKQHDQYLAAVQRKINDDRKSPSHSRTHLDSKISAHLEDESRMSRVVGSLKTLGSKTSSSKPVRGTKYDQYCVDMRRQLLDLEHKRQGSTAKLVRFAEAGRRMLATQLGVNLPAEPSRLSVKAFRIKHT